MSSFDEKILNAVKGIAEDTESVNPFVGKWVSILGDFTSAYESYIPEGNSSYYPKNDVDDVSKMWWYQLITKLGAKLCVNESASGMRLTGVSGEDRAAYKELGKKLHQEPGTYYKNLDGTEITPSDVINPDIVIVYMGITDYTWSMPLGDYSDDVLKTTIPDKSTLETLETDTVSAAYNILLNDIMTTYPNATIYCVSPQTIQKSGSYPFFNNASPAWSMPEFEELVRKLCIKFSARQISLSHYGIRGIDAMLGEDGVATSVSNLTAATHKMIADAIYNKMKKFPITWNTRNDID